MHAEQTAKNKTLTMAIDYYDLIDISDELFDEQHINRLIGEYAERGFTDVQWRVSVLGRLLYHSKLGDMYTNEPLSAGNVPGYGAIVEKDFYKSKAILAKMDPLEVAVRICRKHGIKIYPWLTIYDDAGAHPMFNSNLIRKHPEYCWKAYDANQYYHGVTSYVYPEVVAYRLAQIKELLGYGPDGIHLCTRSHSRPPGYYDAYMKFLMTHPDAGWSATPMHRKLTELTNAARCRFGFDPPAVAAFQDKTGRKPVPEDAEWWKFRGAYVTGFLKKAQALAAGHKAELSFGPRFDQGMFPKNIFDWATMLNEKIVDELHYGATDNYCGTDGIEKEWPEFLAAPGRKNYFHCVKSNKSANDHLKAFQATGNAQFLNKFNGLTIFEAFHLILRPELWSFVDHLKKTMASN